MTDEIRMAPGQETLNRYQGTLEPVGLAQRWLGRCKGCAAAVRVEGVPARDSRGDAAVLGIDGYVYSTRVLNSHELVIVKHMCCAKGVWVYVRPVRDSHAPASKRHTCGARCTNATGPACDCQCRGANHGAGAGHAS